MLKETLRRLEMRARAMAPTRLKALVRAVRSVESIQTSRKLPGDLIRECRFCESRIHMLDDLPHGGVVAELGTYKGDFARHIVARCQPRALHLIDIDFSLFDDSALTGPAISRHQGLAHEVIGTFPDGHFDWIYVDADHSYAGCLQDARAAASKIGIGGFLVFNDFAHIDPGLGRYGVHRAVVDFVREYRWPVQFFAFDGAGLYDIALRKPG